MEGPPSGCPKKNANFQPSQNQRVWNPGGFGWADFRPLFGKTWPQDRRQLIRVHPVTLTSRTPPCTVFKDAFVCFLGYPAPGGSGARSGLSFSSGDRGFCADSGPDPGGNLLCIFILALCAAVLMLRWAFTHCLSVSFRLFSSLLSCLALSCPVLPVYGICLSINLSVRLCLSDEPIRRSPGFKVGWQPPPRRPH